MKKALPKKGTTRDVIRAWMELDARERGKKTKKVTKAPKVAQTLGAKKRK